MSTTIQILQAWQEDPCASADAVADLLDRFFSGELPIEDDRRIFDFMAADEAFGTMVGRMLEAEERLELALDQEARSFRRFREGLVRVRLQVVDGVPRELEVESQPDGALHEDKGEVVTVRLSSPRGASVRAWAEGSEFRLAIAGFPTDWPAPVVNLTPEDDGEPQLLWAQREGDEWLLSAPRLPDGTYSASVATTAPGARPVPVPAAPPKPAPLREWGERIAAAIAWVADSIPLIPEPPTAPGWALQPALARAAGADPSDAGQVCVTGPDGVTITVEVVESQSTIRVCVQDVPTGKSPPRLALLRKDDPSFRQVEEPVLQDTGEYVAVFYNIEPGQEYAVILESVPTE